MNKTKLLVVFVLFVAVVGLTIGSVSAVKYKDWCHGSGPKHKATWTKKYEGKSYVGNVYKHGHLYKKYVKLYTFTCKCKKDRYHREWLRYSGAKHYSYQTYGVFKKPKYVYKRVY